MKQFFTNMYHKPQFWKRFFACLLAVCIMGFCVSWLNLIALGADPCSCMNFGLSSALGMSFGNWQALLNCCLFILVIIWGRDNIGFGTLMNMFLVGYSCDFTTWLREKLWPDFAFSSLGARVFWMPIVLVVFVFAVAVYMSVELGTAPYDAIPIMISQKQNKVSFRLIRIAFDGIVTLIAIGFHATVGVVTILMVFTIGPCAQFVKKHIEKFFS